MSGRGPVAVIGAGWAGCAAAVTLADAGVEVAVYEAGTLPGGRARRVERDGLPIDNGQHLLLGAYSNTLALLERVHGAAAARRSLARRPLAIVPFTAGQTDALTLQARIAPGRLGLLLGLLSARGLTLPERLSNLRWFRRLEREKFIRPAGETVARMLVPLPARVRGLLWEPLCIAALNTPIANACAQTFANVLQAAFAGGSAAGAADFVLPATDLTTLFPESAIRHVVARGGSIQYGAKARILRTDRDSVTLAVRDRAIVVTAAIISVGPHQLRAAFAPEVLDQHRSLDAALEVIDTLSYEPITTIWLGYAEPVPMPAPLVRLDDAPGQWLVDRPDVLTAAAADPARPPLRSLLAVIVSTSGPHTKLAPDALALAADAQLRRLVPTLAPLAWSQTITEKRATYACVPARARLASPALVPGLLLAGDYVNAEFPATLEAAVRSGESAATCFLAQRR